MNETIRTSDQVNEIYGALAKAQAKLENVARDRENAHFHARYATLGAVLDEVRPKLSEQGIAILQMPVNGEGSNVGIVTRLTHSSGQWIESAIYVQPTKFDAQGVGSVLTYLRKYSLMAVAGVGPDDDDAEAAVGRPQPRPQTNGGTRNAAPPGYGNGGTNNKAAMPASIEETPPTGTAEHPKRREAIAAYNRLKRALNAATLPKLVDEIVSINGADLNLIKEVHVPSYEDLMSLSLARKSELLAAA